MLFVAFGHVEIRLEITDNSCGITTFKLSHIHMDVIGIAHLTEQKTCKFLDQPHPLLCQNITPYIGIIGVHNNVLSCMVARELDIYFIK